MTYSAAVILGLAMQCASNVAPQTVAAIVQTESRGHPLALSVNGTRQPKRPTNLADAVVTAKRYIKMGYSVDLGLGQINSRNMGKLGLTWETVFDPCTNIAALGQILSQNYQSVADGRHPQTALRLAISLYNTGSTSRGFRNGYVAKVVGNAGITDGVTANYSEPVLLPTTAADLQSAVTAENATSLERRTVRPAPPPAWNVFERAAYQRKIPTQSASEEGTILWSN